MNTRRETRRSPHSQPNSRPGHPPGNRRPTHLKLVTTSPQRSRRSKTRWWIGLTLVVLAFGWLTGRSPFPTTPGWSALKGVSALKPALQMGGMESYWLTKARFREQVRENLEFAATDSRHIQAESVAVYLFPDLLSDDDFERIEGASLFSPPIDLIERRPHSKEAVGAFNELREDIWNYENASRNEPEISEIAAELLELFETLSRP